MSWLKIKLQAVDDDIDTIADILEQRGAIAISIEAAQTTDVDYAPLLDAGEENLLLENNAMKHWQCSLISGLFPESTSADEVINGIVQQLGAPAVATCETQWLEDQDWETAWRDHYQPLQVTERLWVCPSWSSPPASAQTTVFIDPGLAFGTGTHASTQLCLEWLSEQHLTGKTIIDYGCGSGILAITALRLGADTAWGVDVDRRALAVSADNAERNGVGRRYRPLLPDMLPENLETDIVVANILADTLITLAPVLMARVQRNGRLALSGILASQIRQVCEAYPPQFRFTSRLRAENSPAAGQDSGKNTQALVWGLLVGTRSA